ncbi:MAG TPA: hypothetical protein VKU19_35780, partial [Bryobacteraceae bacterium]|nr:hypothetical protein [Bryobacteraceae bacterium]
MRLVRQSCIRRGFWSGVALFTLLLVPVMAQTGVTVGFANNSLNSLKYNGVEYLANGVFQVNRVMLVDSQNNEVDGSTSGSASITAPNTITVSYSWGTVQLLYAPSGNRLNLTITTTNTSAQTIGGLFYNVLNLKFPSRVQEYDGVTPLVDSNLGAPTLISMTS